MANEFIGRRVKLGISKEATRGVGAATVTYGLPWSVLSFQERYNKATEEEGFGVIDGADDAFVTQGYADGMIEGDITDKAFGLLLYNLLGSVSSAVKETTAYNHTFTVAQTNTHQSLSIFVTDPIGRQEFTLSMLNALDIDVELGKIVPFKADFVSRLPDDSGATITMTAENKFVAKHAQCKIAVNLAGLAAASVLNLKKVSLKFSKNTIKDFALGTMTAVDIFNQALNVEGELEINYNDAAVDPGYAVPRVYRDYVRDGSFKALRIDLINTGVTIGASSNPELQINLPRVHFYDWEAKRELDNIATQVVKFRALRDVSGGNDIVSSIVLTNTATSY